MIQITNQSRRAPSKAQSARWEYWLADLHRNWSYRHAGVSYWFRVYSAVKMLKRLRNEAVTG